MSGGSSFKASLGKKFIRPHFNRKELGIVACTCHSSHGRKLKIGGSRSRPAWAKREALSQKQQSKKD
jgi:hypothetical protein